MLAEADAPEGTEEQRRDLEIAEKAGGPTETVSEAKPRQPSSRTNAPAIGRNEVVTIEEPATGERRELKWKKAEALVKDGWRLV